MLVAIDYDDTISAAPGSWVEIINAMKAVGFRVIVVTYRQPNCDPHELEWLRPHVSEIIFTGQTNKQGFCKKLGLIVDVWVDDTPMSITHDYHAWVWQLPE